MARRGEGQFVAIEVNLRGDPVKAGRISRLLRVSRNEAVGMIAAWRELVLTRGEGSSGLLKGYPAEDIADFLDWTGKGRKPAQLIAALKAADELGCRRGTYLYPSWSDTPTGWYAAKRAGDRDRKRRGGSAEVPRNGEGASAEPPSRSGQEVSKEPPEAPPPGGVGVADARVGLTEWFLETYPRLRNEREVRRRLAQLTPVEAVQLRYCLPKQLPRYISGMTGRGGRGVPFADKYLRDGFYLEIRPPKAKPPKEKQNGHSRAEQAEEKRLLVERQEALWKRRDEIKARLKDEGVLLSKHELEARVDQELEQLEQQQEGAAGLS